MNINLYRENKEFALSVSIRYNEGVIVRNAMVNNVWGAEEREGKMPISKGEMSVSFSVITVTSFQFRLHHHQRGVLLPNLRQRQAIRFVRSPRIAY